MLFCTHHNTRILYLFSWSKCGRMESLNLYAGVILVNTQRGRKERKENTLSSLVNDIYISAARRWSERREPKWFWGSRRGFVFGGYKSQVLSESQVQINEGGICKAKQWQRVFFLLSGEKRKQKVFGVKQGKFIHAEVSSFPQATHFGRHTSHP